MSELLPCPFCGSAPRFIDDDSYGMAQVFCANTACPAEPSVIGQTETAEQVAAAWNRRAVPNATLLPTASAVDQQTAERVTPEAVASDPVAVAAAQDAAKNGETK